MFYTFGQNNSGGSFITDAVCGVGVYVIVEAVSSDDACDRFLAISDDTYFDGVSKGLDCECCGSRWCSVPDYFEEFPSVCHKDVGGGVYYQDPMFYWYSDEEEDCFAFIHYLDGRVVRVRLES